MLTVKIDARRVLFNGTLLLKDGETARIDISLPLGAAIATEVVKVALLFTDPAQSGITGVWGPRGDTMHFEFKGFQDASPTPFPEPLGFGTQGNQNLYLQMVHQRVGDQNLVHLAVLRDGD